MIDKKETRRQLLFIAIERALDYIYDIVNGDTFGVPLEEKGRSEALAQIEVVRLAVNALRKEQEGGAK